MSIHPQIKNLLKLLLVGAVLFTISLTLSVGCSKQNAVKNGKQICQADITKKIYADAQKQTRLESPDLLFVNADSVKASVPPAAVTPQVLASIVGSQDDSDSNITADGNKSILEYTVEQNDTLVSLAQKFNLDVQTLLWANDLKNNAVLMPGITLVIPPVDGLIYNVVAGDTISKIAKTYKAKDADIIAFNELQGENDLYVGDQIIIPGGKISVVQLAPKPGSNSTGLTLPGDYFLCPIGGATCTRTQGLHFNNAVDLSHGKCGDPIYAAASGTVMRAKVGGWNGGAGNYITILHPSGAVTKYYHLQAIFVVSGQQVVKGQNVALMGGQPGVPGSGNSTGCHLHFEVIGTRQPF
jgi:murein DD-endopeptidase MepM/ murein hydrolase activator NlpD